LIIIFIFLNWGPWLVAVGGIKEKRRGGGLWWGIILYIYFNFPFTPGVSFFLFIFILLVGYFSI